MHALRLGRDLCSCQQKDDFAILAITGFNESAEGLKMRNSGQRYGDLELKNL